MDGAVQVSTDSGTLSLERGKAALLGASEDPAVLTGQGITFVSASGLR
ncbi:MAG: hypothetical protein IPL43_16000 [Micropruina sp.]|nr:hypothetical protein [Micropruina sp.]